MKLLTQKIIGLDIGTSSIKAVCLTKRLGRLEWGGGFRLDLPEPSPVLDWSRISLEGLKEWLDENQLPVDRVVVSLPGQAVSIRSVTLPFSDSRRIEKVVPYEVESLLPLSLDEVVVDFQVSGDFGGSSRVLVAAAPKTLIRGLLVSLGEMGINPETVDLDGMALMNLNRYITARAGGGDSQPEEDTLIIDIGSKKTVLCGVHRGSSVFIRTLLGGGDDISKAIQEKCGTSAEEAEEWKRQVGLKDDGISRLHEKGVSKAVSGTLDRFVSEVRRTLHLYSIGDRENGSGEKVHVDFKRLALCGGGSKLRGLETYLSQELGLQPADLTPRIGSNGSKGWDPEYAVGLGLALKGTRQAGVSRMNFRKAEFSSGLEQEVSSKKGQALWIAGVLLALVAGVDIYTKYDLKVQEHERLKTEVEVEFKKIFPDVRVVDPVHQARTSVLELEKN
ncbi:MAG TPA: pilus assembly protein PilM, partial [Nitrospiria bacterium]|nr:pilus assembly protein PilM [Nitrospiria bacterium]